MAIRSGKIMESKLYNWGTPKNVELHGSTNNQVFTGGPRVPKLLEKMKLSNGWATSASIKAIGGNRPSIKGRDLMVKLGLQLIQRTPVEKVMTV